MLSQSASLSLPAAAFPLLQTGSLPFSTCPPCPPGLFLLHSLLPCSYLTWPAQSLTCFPFLLISPVVGYWLVSTSTLQNRQSCHVLYAFALYLLCKFVVWDWKPVTCLFWTSAWYFWGTLDFLPAHLFFVSRFDRQKHILKNVHRKIPIFSCSIM